MLFDSLFVRSSYFSLLLIKIRYVSKTSSLHIPQRRAINSVGRDVIFVAHQISWIKDFILQVGILGLV